MPSADPMNQADTLSLKFMGFKQGAVFALQGCHPRAKE